MGSWWSKKQHQFDDVFDEFEFETFIVHNAIRRSINKIEELASQPDKLLTSMATYEAFLKYTNVFQAFLNAHHHHEDDLIFVRAREFAGQPTLMHQEQREHLAAHEQIERLVELCAAAEKTSDGAAVATNEKEEAEEARCGDAERRRIEQIHQSIKVLNELMSSHLQREEQTLTGEFYRENATTEDLNKVRSDLHTMIKSDEELKGAGIVWLGFHLTDVEKIYFQERMPFFVYGGFLYNRAAATLPTAAWELSPNYGADAYGRPSWGYPEWSDDEKFTPFSKSKIS